ncbi:MAG TPA: MoaD/ThiS family protein [Candidatus Acidoferrales bacterium]|nr:MoaD/ThiS family protein [Candidatus Acidoferrales bacterium]
MKDAETPRDAAKAAGGNASPAGESSPRAAKAAASTAAGRTTIRVALPHHLRTLAKLGNEISLEIAGSPTLRAVLDALEQRYPMLSGTIRDHVTQERRPFLRFFACEQDLSHESPDAPLPAEVISGKEPLIILGAIAGG